MSTYWFLRRAWAEEEKARMSDRSKEVSIYSKGLVACSVCAPKDMTIEEVTIAVNTLNPTGLLSHGWSLSDDKKFSNGEPMPRPCETDPGRMHYLFTC